MTYTLQKELDGGGLGARWGCAFMGPINCCEHARSKKATRAEVSLIVGEAFRTQCVSMANYKNDKYIRPKRTPPEGWGPLENPEWAYLIEAWSAYSWICKDVLKKDIDYSQYKIAIMMTQFGTRHYCALARKLLINPDPTLHGKIIEIKDYPV